MDRMLFVSADGHAVMPEALWPEYLEPGFHDLLPRLIEENRRFTNAMLPLNDYDLIYDGVVTGSHYDVFDQQRLFRDGQWAGGWDLDIRLAQMDQEGVAAEFVFPGYFRSTDLFFNVSNTVYPPEAAEAGIRAHNRWLHDAFGPAGDRLLLVGAVGRCLDLEVLLRELTWIADHGFTGTFMPGFTGHPDLPPLHDPHWEPVWALCADRNLALIVHGGYGMEPGGNFEALTGVFERVTAAGGSNADAVRELRSGIFNDGFFVDMRCRRPLWQLMLGGVFDRHPGLRLMMTEVRADWIPDTIAHLDAAYDANRDAVPATRRPSEYWQSNCMAGLSFMHRSEVAMRDKIGVATISFGRDYPHTEGTWPNTTDYLRTLFAGVPAEEVRMMLGENLADFLGLDRGALAPVVDRIGLTVDDVLGASPDLSADLLAHFDARCGLGKPAEGDRHLPKVAPLVEEDLQRVGAR
jgi:predicted TIM-barrel fold metal-dependent hydrolase